MIVTKQMTSANGHTFPVQVSQQAIDDLKEFHGLDVWNEIQKGIDATDNDRNADIVAL